MINEPKCMEELIEFSFREVSVKQIPMSLEKSSMGESPTEKVPMDKDLRSRQMAPNRATNETSRHLKDEYQNTQNSRRHQKNHSPLWETENKFTVSKNIV